MHQHAGFPTASTGQYKDLARGGRDGLLLRLVEVREGGCDRHPPILTGCRKGPLAERAYPLQCRLPSIQAERV